MAAIVSHAHGVAVVGSAGVKNAAVPAGSSRIKVTAQMQHLKFRFFELSGRVLLPISGLQTVKLHSS